MRGSEGGRQKTEERGKGQDGTRGGRRKMRRRRGGVMAVASTAGLGSSGLAAWGEVYGAMVEGGGRRGER